MPNLKIAAMLPSLRMEEYAGLRKIVEMGVPAVHLSARGRFAPEALDAAERKKVLDDIRSLGLEISAVSGWGGEVDLCERDKHPKGIAGAKEMIDLCADLENPIWQAHVGVMPVDTDNERWESMVDAMAEIAKHGESRGVCLAIETGPEPPFVVKRLIETIGSKALRVNYDPANLILWPAILAEQGQRDWDRTAAWGEFEPIEGVRTLAPYIVHTHAKDAMVTDHGGWMEVPLGKGLIDWPRYVALLKEAGYDGYFAIEREVGEDPIADIMMAVEFLRSL